MTDYLGVIGKGSFGEIHLIYNREKHKLEAIKTLEKKKSASVQQEIINHNQVNSHPNIINFNYVYISDNLLCISLDYAFPGDMFNWFKDMNRTLLEFETIYYFKQLLNAVEHCHNKNIVHRDIKLENLLLHDNIVKLADFGYSEEIDKADLTRVIGTPQYIAPELLLRKAKDPVKTDIWSCGVVLYILLVGSYPFKGGNEINELLTNIATANYEIPPILTDNCKDLISKILEINPEKRFTIKEIRSHPWMRAVE